MVCSPYSPPTNLALSAADLRPLQERLLANLSGISQAPNSLSFRQTLAALQRVAAGTYGTCEQCRSPISLGRLAARPVVSLCLDCQMVTERENIQQAHYSEDIFRISTQRIA